MAEYIRSSAGDDTSPGAGASDAACAGTGEDERSGEDYCKTLTAAGVGWSSLSEKSSGASAVPVLTEDEMRAVFGRVATSLSARAAELLEALSTRALGEGVDLDKAAHRTRVAAYAAVDARAVCTSLSALPGAEAACAPLEAFGVRGP